MLYAAKDVTAMSAAQALLLCVGTFSVPSQLISDNGTQYVAQVITDLLTLMGTQHITITLGSHQENNFVERANKEVNRRLREFCFDRGIFNRWSQVLPIVQRIFNSDIKEALGVSRAQVLFGNALDLDRGILLQYTASPTTSTLSEWTASMLEAQRVLLQTAYDKQLISNRKHLDQDLALTEFPVGSYVLVSYELKPPDKLHTHYQGPLKVVASRGSIYSLQNLVTEVIRDYHISRLQPFYYDPSDTDPMHIAMKDNQLFVVDQILDMQGNPNASRRLLSFKVRWAGLSADHDTWESYANLRHNVKLHEFLITRKLRRLIPASDKS